MIVLYINDDDHEKNKFIVCRESIFQFRLARIINTGKNQWRKREYCLYWNVYDVSLSLFWCTSEWRQNSHSSSCCVIFLFKYSVLRFVYTKRVKKLFVLFHYRTFFCPCLCVTGELFFLFVFWMKTIHWFSVKKCANLLKKSDWDLLLLTFVQTA